MNINLFCVERKNNMLTGSCRPTLPGVDASWSRGHGAEFTRRQYEY